MFEDNTFDENSENSPKVYQIFIFPPRFWKLILQIRKNKCLRGKVQTTFYHYTVWQNYAYPGICIALENDVVCFWCPLRKMLVPSGFSSMSSLCSEWAIVIVLSLSCSMRHPSSLVNFLPRVNSRDTILDQYSWNLVRMFALIISQMRLKMGHASQKLGPYVNS